MRLSSCCVRLWRVQFWLLLITAMMVLLALLAGEGPARAQTPNYCPAPDTPTIGYGPYIGYPVLGGELTEGGCAICCDTPGGRVYWHRLPQWHRYCYPTATKNRQPTPTKTPVPAADTATPTATRTPVPAPATARGIPGSPTPVSTLRTAPEPSDSSESAQKWRPDCIPAHAGRPVALCETGSGSGWWLHFAGWGLVLTGPYIPYNGSGEREYIHPIIDQLVTVTWPAPGTVRIATAYADGKPYTLVAYTDQHWTHEEW